MANHPNLPGKCSPQRILLEFQKKYPGLWDFVSSCRAGRGKTFEWPDWCFIPMAACHAYVMQDIIHDPSRHPEFNDLSPVALAGRMNDIAIATALAGWRMTMSVYNFAPDLAARLASAPLDKIPVAQLLALPEWCLYIQAPDGLEMQGFFAHLEYDYNTRRAELRFVFDFGDSGLIALPVHLTTDNIDESLSDVVDVGNFNADTFDAPLPHLSNSPQFRRDLADKFGLPACLALLAYLCSPDADFGDERPTRPSPVKTKRGWQLFPAQKPRFWLVK